MSYFNGGVDKNHDVVYFYCFHWGLGIVGLTAFVVSGGTVGCRNGNLRWHRDDFVGARADDLSFSFSVLCIHMFIVYSVHSHGLVGD